MFITILTKSDDITYPDSEIIYKSDSYDECKKVSIEKLTEISELEDLEFNEVEDDINHLCLFVPGDETDERYICKIVKI